MLAAKLFRMNTYGKVWQLRVKRAHGMENEQCYGRKTSICL